ncbi:MAG TPA: hypothetical protein VJV23_14935 [Candidatus Polarisedimenticolia bacterium]|nr:hypothetical protein [Candidatus Polarisedimenticolia bacterium]
MPTRVHGTQARRPARGAGAAACVLAAALAAGAAPPEAHLKGWTRLTLASEPALLYSGSTTLEVREGTHPGTGRKAAILATRSAATLLGGIGLEEETTSWIDRSTGRPIELLQIRPAQSRRRLLYLDGAVRQTTWEPPEGNPAAPADAWPEVETAERKLLLPDGQAPPATEWMGDAYALIHALRGMDLRPADAVPREFNVLHRRRLVRMRVEPGPARVQERTVRDEGSGAPVTLRLTERRLLLKGSGEEGGSVRGLLGMQGDLEMWVDVDSGALVEIRGAVPGLGPAAVSLASFRR